MATASVVSKCRIFPLPVSTILLELFAHDEWRLNPEVVDEESVCSTWP